MCKRELIKEIGHRTRYAVKDVGLVVDAMLDTIRDELANFNDVDIVDFGRFYVKEVHSRKYRDFHDGEWKFSEPKQTVSFKANIRLKEAVNDYVEG